MWNKPQTLIWLSDILYSLAFVAFIIAVSFAILNSPAFPIQKIRIFGNIAHVNRAQVQHVMRAAMRGNFFTLNIRQTRSAFERLPWVRQVVVRRLWPGVLDVHIEEHRAFARWNDDALVNDFGEIFLASTPYALPRFRGPDGAGREMHAWYLQYRKILAPLGLHIAQFELSARRACQIRLSNGMHLMIGRDKWMERIERFARVYQNAFEARRFIHTVDLRYPNGLAIRATAPLIAFPEPSDTRKQHAALAIAG